MKKLLSLFLAASTLGASAATLTGLAIERHHSFAQGACDDEQGWYALRCWTAELDIQLMPGESGQYVIEYCTTLGGQWHELNNNPLIGFPPYASFNGAFFLPARPAPAIWSFAYPSPPLETMFLRLKRIGDTQP